MESYFITDFLSRCNFGVSTFSYQQFFERFIPFFPTTNLSKNVLHHFYKIFQCKKKIRPKQIAFGSRESQKVRRSLDEATNKD